jgi:hypothetical protein
MKIEKQNYKIREEDKMAIFLTKDSFVYIMKIEKQNFKIREEDKIL